MDINKTVFYIVVGILLLLTLIIVFFIILLLLRVNKIADKVDSLGRETDDVNDQLRQMLRYVRINKSESDNQSDNRNKQSYENETRNGTRNGTELRNDYKGNSVTDSSRTNREYNSRNFGREASRESSNEVSNLRNNYYNELGNNSRRDNTSRDNAHSNNDPFINKTTRLDSDKRQQIEQGDFSTPEAVVEQPKSVEEIFLTDYNDVLCKNFDLQEFNRKYASPIEISIGKGFYDGITYNETTNGLVNYYPRLKEKAVNIGIINHKSLNNLNKNDLNQLSHMFRFTSERPNLCVKPAKLFKEGDTFKVQEKGEYR